MDQSEFMSVISLSIVIIMFFFYVRQLYVETLSIIWSFIEYSMSSYDHNCWSSLKYESMEEKCSSFN
jgi:hypothetical protein